MIIELMLLSVTILVLVMAYNDNDTIGQIYSMIIIIATAGAESAINK